MRDTPIPQGFRKLSYEAKRERLRTLFELTEEQVAAISGVLDLSDLSDVLIENAIGSFPIPLGVVTGLCVDGREILLPMATEEPSVVAAANFGAALTAAAGGVTTAVDEPVMGLQIFLINPLPDSATRLIAANEQIHQLVDALIPAMKERGGGFREMEVERLLSGRLCVKIAIDVRDAMGANLLNTVGEKLRSHIEGISGADSLMAILTNSAEKRLTRAEFSLPFRRLARGEWSGEQIAERICLASEIAHECPERAVTHNKGIMNGVSSLVLATGNDTRAVEAAAHFHAQSTGHYLPLSRYAIEGECLVGRIELPVPLGTVGGSTTIWPPSVLAMRLIGDVGARELSGYAAALGLVQNLAALAALVGEGIQMGHMTRHAARLAYQAGARGEEVRRLAERLWACGEVSLAKAQRLREE
ncbi:MAG: hydroxymethylglutaryl-CoA reductase, degradative [Chlamydiia bacterium]|nr:hydroxymethylglutaryl-CoA reductase, degradative [Chlamydiia bacterium]